MTAIHIERLNEIAAIADTLPAQYQVPAFRELLRSELGTTLEQATNPGVDTDPDGASSGQVTLRSSTAQHPDWFRKVYEQMPEPHLFAVPDRTTQTVWALVELYARNEPATPKAVRELIRVELGLSPEVRQHASNRLGKLTPQYANRFPVDKGRGYRYEPTKNIADLFPKEDESG